VTLVDQQLLQAAGHMRSRGMSHFDPHFDNVLTDGHRIYLSDFGLATSRQFRSTAQNKTSSHSPPITTWPTARCGSGQHHRQHAFGLTEPRERND